MSDIAIGRIRIGVVLGLLVVAGVVLLLLPFVALRWNSTPFPGFFIDPNLIVSATGEPDFFGKQIDPSITYPQRVVTLDGILLTDNAELHNRLSEMAIGDEVTLTLEVVGNSPSGDDMVFEREVIAPLSRLDAAALWNQFWLFYFVGLIVFLIGAWTFWVRPTNESSQVFALFTAVGSISIAAVFDQVTSQQFLPLWVLVLPLSGGFFLWFAAIYPHETNWLEKYPWARWVIVLTTLLIGVWGVVWLDHPDPRAYVLPWQVSYITNGVVLLIGLGAMAYRGYASPSPIVRQQGRVIFAAGLIAFSPIIAFFLLSSFNVPLDWLTTPLYIPPVLLFPFVIAYTIVQYGLLNLTMVRRGFAYAMMTGLLVLIFALLTAGLTSSSRRLADSPWWIAVAVVVVALVFEPLRNRLQFGLDRLFFRNAVTFDGLLRVYNRELTTAVSIENVADLLLSFVQQGIPDTGVYLFFPDQQSGEYRSYVDLTDLSFPFDSPFIAFLKRRTGSIDLSETRAWPSAVRNTPTLANELGVGFIVPIQGQDGMLGWLALTPTRARTQYTPTEMGFVVSLAERSALGLERATVVRQLEDRVTELDQLSTFSQFLAFTIDTNDLFELVYTNNQRLLGVEDFFIALNDSDKDMTYVAFYVEGDQRDESEEGAKRPLTEKHVQDAISSGQVVKWVDSSDCPWIASPLNVGAETLGAVYTRLNTPNATFGIQQENLFVTYTQRTAVALERLQTSERLRQQAEQLRIINQVTLSLSNTLELDKLLDLIMDKAIELFDAPAGSLMLREADTGELRFHVVRGPAEKELLGTKLPLGAGIAGTVAQTTNSIITNDAATDKRWFGNVDEDTHFQTRSILTVPLLRQNRVLGVLQVINKGSGVPFNEEDKRLLNAFASQAVVALENARLVEQTDQKLQSSVNELSMLQQLDRDLNASLALENVLNITLDRLLAISDGHAGAIVLNDLEGEPKLHTTRKYDWGIDPHNVDAETMKNGLVGVVLASGEPVIVNNVHEEKKYLRANFETMSQLTIPLVHQQETIGVIVIESEQMDRFSDEDAETAVRIANHAAIAIANALLYEQVTAANQAKSEFVSMVSHELKTPMTAVKGYADLMLAGLTGELTEQQRDYLEIVVANMQRMGQQIQDLTDISRIEMNRLHMELAPTKLQTVMDDTMKTMSNLCDEKSIHVHISLPDSLPCIEADKSRLVQVMTNLISNACKYSPPETDVFVRFIQKQHNNQPVIAVAVQDNGYGISAEDQEQLFTKFFRSDDPNIRQAKGTGLGLSITKGIVELHGGEMWLESAVGQGTTFYFTLPVSNN